MKLSVQIEFDKTLDLVTPKNNVVIGRSPKSDIVIPHDSISRSHCRIELDKGIFYITDLGSSNGTSLDGQRINAEERIPFLTSSQLTLGKLDCELSEGDSAPTDGKALPGASPLPTKGDYTATMRVSRLDLNKPVRTADPASKLKSKGPKNPVTEVSKKKSPPKDNKRGYILLFILVSGIVAYLINEGMN
jgi:predicted component of type VI protein secretion system